MATILKMSNKKPADRHKSKTFTYRLHPLTRRGLEKLIALRLTSFAAEINEAVHERLKVFGLWPIPEEEAKLILEEEQKRKREAKKSREKGSGK